MTTKHIEDPRIAEVAKLEHDAMLAEVTRRYIDGQDWFHARETVMAERGNEITKTYGKDVAIRAIAALQQVDPSRLPGEVHSARYTNSVNLMLWIMDHQHGGEHYWTPRQQWLHANRHHFNMLAACGYVCILFSSIAGAAASVWAGFTWSGFWSGLLWSVGLGTLFILIWAMSGGGMPKRRETGETLEEQRKRMDAESMGKYYADIEREQKVEQDRREKEKWDREYRDTLLRIERDRYIDAYQERRRLGTSLPSDPIYIPKAARRIYTKRARNF
jgi:hypothetical protein